jgi:hypothetical protein
VPSGEPGLASWRRVMLSARRMNTRGIPSAHSLGARWVLVLMSGLLGCGGAVNGNSSGGSGEGPQGVDPLIQGLPDAGPGLSACDHYYAAQYTRCGGPVLPATEGARVRARYLEVCLNEMALPGSGMTPASVEACALALDSSACELPDGPPVPCNFNGSLAGGAACNEGLQCQSGQCQGTAAFSPGGPIGPVTCGTCAPFVGIGQACGQGGCGSNANCLLGPDMETAKDPQYTCVAITQGDVGATCDDLSAICKTGLYCAAQTGKCTALGDAGPACGEGTASPGDPGGCAAPLSCVGLPGMATCSTGGAGAFCLNDLDCSPGLGCVPGPCSSSIARIGCSASGTCQPVAWASAGQACDGYRTHCLVGSCNAGPGTESPDGGLAQGTCPSVVADGQACSVQGVGLSAGFGPTCDTFAECFRATGPAGSTGPSGTCTSLDSTVCR